MVPSSGKSRSETLQKIFVFDSMSWAKRAKQIFGDVLVQTGSGLGFDTGVSHGRKIVQTL